MLTVHIQTPLTNNPRLRFVRFKSKAKTRCAPLGTARASDPTSLCYTSPFQFISFVKFLLIATRILITQKGLQTRKANNTLGTTQYHHGTATIQFPSIKIESQPRPDRSSQHIEPRYLQIFTTIYCIIINFK